jgi:hypothetical protein
VFAIGGEAPATVSERLASGWTVELRHGSTYVIARGGHETTYQDARKAALLAANEGLDFMSMRGTCSVSVVRSDDDHVVWWKEKNGVVLRTVGFVTLSVEVPIPTLRLLDPATGEERPQPPPPPERWHESFRYLRLSQVTDDLFEAYRNAYLALESILDEFHPKSAGGEKRWLTDALTAVSAHVDLKPFVSAGSTNPVQEIVDDFYNTHRTALFHAKGSQGFFLPHDAAERAAVTATLTRLIRLYIALASALTNVRRPSSAITAYFFRLQTQHLDKTLRIVVTDDEKPFDPKDEVVNPTGGRVIALKTRPAPDYERPFVRAFLGRAPGSDLDLLTHIGRVCSTMRGDVTQPLAANYPEGRLEVAGLRRFEALMGIRARNVHQPRSDYPS